MKRAIFYSLATVVLVVGSGLAEAAEKTLHVEGSTTVDYK